MRKGESLDSFLRKRLACFNHDGENLPLLVGFESLTLGFGSSVYSPTSFLPGRKRKVVLTRSHNYHYHYQYIVLMSLNVIFLIIATEDLVILFKSRQKSADKLKKNILKMYLRINLPVADCINIGYIIHWIRDNLRITLSNLHGYVIQL